MTSEYGTWWLKMAIVYHRKRFFTHNKWWRGMIVSWLKLLALGIRKTRIRIHIKVEHLTDSEFLSARSKIREEHDVNPYLPPHREIYK